MADKRTTMRRRLGLLCMVAGTVLMAAAVALLVYNERQAQAAAQSAAQLLPQLVQQIESSRTGEEPQPALPDQQITLDETGFTPPEMTEVVIGGYGYIGYLSIPSLELELPVMADWDYARLRKSPCRYSGTVLGGDLVVMAHNYNRHFGRLSELNPGDSVSFTDMDGVLTEYAVVALDILMPEAVEEMTSGESDLTLFTCTYGGKSRVTVYCDRIQK